MDLSARNTQPTSQLSFGARHWNRQVKNRKKVEGNRRSLTILDDSTGTGDSRLAYASQEWRRSVRRSNAVTAFKHA
jgi:hypothetical protein